MGFEETLIDSLFTLGAVPKYVILLQEQGNRPFLRRECTLMVPRHFNLAMPWPDMHSMDGRQQGVGRLLPAVNDACSVSEYSALVRRKKGRMTQILDNRTYLGRHLKRRSETGKGCGRAKSPRASNRNINKRSAQGYNNAPLHHRTGHRRNPPG